MKKTFLSKIPLNIQFVSAVSLLGLLSIWLLFVLFTEVYSHSRTPSFLLDQYVLQITQISGIDNNLGNIALKSQNHILSTREEEKLKFEVSIEESFEQIDFLTKKLYALIKDTESLDLYNLLLNEYESYRTINKEILTLSTSGNLNRARDVAINSQTASYRKLTELLDKTLSASTTYTQNHLNNTINSRKHNLIIIIVIVSFILLTSVIIGVLSFNKLQHNLNNINKQISTLSRGETPTKIQDIGDAVIGEIAQNLNLFVDNLTSLQNFAIEIGKENYTTQFKSKGKQDLLGSTLLNLRDNLAHVAKEEEKRRLEDARRGWTTEGLATFAELLRQSSDDTREFGSVIIKNTVKYLKANQGGLFVLNDSDPNNIYLELVSSYAYDRQKFIEKKVQIGEGLVGACVVEKSTRYLTEIPEEYIKIASGLGKASPKSILIVPLKVESQILGVLELASFNYFQKHEIEFIEKLSESIASTLSTARINTRTAMLLEESKKQSEELANQEEKMRRNLEQMKTAQEEAARREAELNNMLKAIDYTLIKGEYEINGNLISANDRYLDTMGYRMHEVKGKNIKMFVPAEELKEFTQTWQKVCEGSPIETTIRRKTKTGDDLWLQISYMPVVDEYKEVYKILALAINITDQKRIEDELKLQAQQLAEQEKNNKKFLTQTQQRTKELAEKDEKLKRNMEEIQLLQKELSSKSENQKNKEIELSQKYEKEIISMWDIWNRHLNKIASLIDLHLKQRYEWGRTNEQYQKQLLEYSQQIQQQTTTNTQQLTELELERINIKQKIDTEEHKLYDKWLKKIKDTLEE